MEYTTTMPTENPSKLSSHCQSQPKPNLAGLSLAIYPISTPTPPPIRKGLETTYTYTY